MSSPILWKVRNMSIFRFCQIRIPHNGKCLVSFIPIVSRFIVGIKTKGDGRQKNCVKGFNKCWCSNALWCLLDEELSFRINSSYLVLLGLTSFINFWTDWTTLYWAPQKNLVKGWRQTLNCYCVGCELFTAGLLFVNIPASGIFHGRFAHRLAVNKPCLQIIRFVYR